MSDHLMNTYARLPVTFTHGEACGCGIPRQRYLDALSGIAACGLGHAHPKVTAAISAQADACCIPRTQVSSSSSAWPMS